MYSECTDFGSTSLLWCACRLVLLLDPKMLQWERAFRDILEMKQGTRNRGGLHSEGRGTGAGPNENRASNQEFCSLAGLQ
jgi:hypothetical protein